MDTVPHSAYDSNTPLKRCFSCPEGNQWHPATTEYFHAAKRGKYGVGNRCKTCRRAYLQANKERTADARKKYKQAHKEHLRACDKVYEQTHKEQRAATIKKYRQAHKEEVDARSRAYHKRVDKNHPEQRRARYHTRRAREKGCGGTHTAADIRKQYANQKGKCYYCKGKVGTNYHVDHVIPISKGGSNGPENIVIACPTCNWSKHDKIIRLL